MSALKAGRFIVAVLPLWCRRTLGPSSSTVTIRTPREMVHIDSTDNESLNLELLNLKCGDNAASLAVVDSPSAPLN